MPKAAGGSIQPENKKRQAGLTAGGGSLPKQNKPGESGHSRPVYYLAAGQPEQAIDHLKLAVTIFTEIGGGALDMQPEVWKLTEW